MLHALSAVAYGEGWPYALPTFGTGLRFATPEPFPGCLTPDAGHPMHAV